MPSISYDSLAAWSNYHLTLGNGAAPVPSRTIELLGRVHGADVAALPALDRFAATAATLFGHLGKLEAMLDAKPPARPRSFAAGMVGRGWSFSNLIGTPVSTLVCDGLAGTAELHADDWNPACGVPADHIALTSGGTRLREIVNWAERRGLTVATSGTHLGPTIAGGACTASHGSRLGYGGMQNMIIGMHLIVGKAEHVWLERASCPVLSAAGLRKLEVPGAALTHLADDEMFEDALIHLGAMGIVNGVAMQLVANDSYALMRRRAPLDPDWLTEIGNGQFGRIAARLRCRAEPVFYEITISPTAPFEEDAAHILYFARSGASLTPPGSAANARPADAIGRVRDWARDGDAARVAAANSLGSRDPAVARTLRMLLGGHESVFRYYLDLGAFEPNETVFDPDERPGFYWSGLHGDEITGNMPGSLYNASFAIPLDRVPVAVPAICGAVSRLEPTFVFTLRFVSKAAGTLAFTRFTECAVIEIDGLSPLICGLAAADLDPAIPDPDEIRAALARMAKTLPTGAAAVRRALDAAAIPYSMHWAKLGDLDRAKVYADYGHPADIDASLIRRWRETRDRLLSPLGKRLFWNDEIVSLGLLDPPSPTPAA